NLVIYPEGTRSQDGSLGKFLPGAGHLATQDRTPVVPVHIAGTHRIMPKGRRVPLPAPATVRIGKPVVPGSGEGSRDFIQRVEGAVRSLASGRPSAEVTGSWVERWQAAGRRRPIDS